MGYIAAAIAVVGGILGGIAKVQAIDAQASAEGTIRRAKLLEAQSIRESAAYNEARQRTAAAHLIAKQRAAGASAGLDISSGSPLALELFSVQQAELDALNIRRTGEVRAMGSEFEASLAKFRKQLFQKKADMAILESSSSAGGSLGGMFGGGGGGGGGEAGGGAV